jgi:hypothetical protein
MGHYNYYGLPGNSVGLSTLYYWVLRTWHKWLSRCSQKGYISWDDFNAFLRRHPLIPPRIRRPNPPKAVLRAVA